MVMVGDYDPITPVADSEDMVSMIRPDLVRYERFTNSGHSVWRDEPEKAFRVIREFIAS
jgi:proline iminopeptidase